MPQIFGWLDSPKDVERGMKTLKYPVFGDVGSPIKDTGKGKVVLLYKIIEDVAGYFPYRDQDIGDCVSMGAAYAGDAVKAVDIFIKGDFEQWIAETCTEAIYGGSRIIIGKGQLGYSDGSYGIWAAKWLTNFGAIARAKYDKYDLTKYDGNRARNWGRPDVAMPQIIIDESKQHPIEICSQVKTYAEVRDLIANGYPVTIASSRGFNNTRDADGFLKPYGSWPHQMCILGVDDSFRRPGVLIQNSWGRTWVTGPKRHNQPDGSFWCDADVLEKYILAAGDSWAFSGYKGYEIKELTKRII